MSLGLSESVQIRMYDGVSGESCPAEVNNITC